MKKSANKNLQNKKVAQPRIVSSEHLVSKKSPELSELEFGMIIAWHAFERWMIRCISATGIKDVTPTDVLIIHHVNHRQTQKKLSDICFTLNIEDTHIVSYGLKKLICLFVAFCVLILLKIAQTVILFKRKRIFFVFKRTLTFN